jgi:hypothetical protein
MLNSESFALLQIKTFWKLFEWWGNCVKLQFEWVEKEWEQILLERKHGRWKQLEEGFRNHNHCYEHTGLANAHGKCNIHKWIRFQAFPSLFHVLFLSNLTNTTYFWPLFNFPLPKQRSLLIRMRPQITAQRTVSLNCKLFSFSSCSNEN